MKKKNYKSPCADLQLFGLTFSMMTSSDGVSGDLEDSLVDDISSDDSFWSF